MKKTLVAADSVLCNRLCEKDVVGNTRTDVPNEVSIVHDEAMVQHFSDGSTRVLCRYALNEKCQKPLLDGVSQSDDCHFAVDAVE